MLAGVKRKSKAKSPPKKILQQLGSWSVSNNMVLMVIPWMCSSYSVANTDPDHFSRPPSVNLTTEEWPFRTTGGYFTG